MKTQSLFLTGVCIGLAVLLLPDAALSAPDSSYSAAETPDSIAEAHAGQTVHVFTQEHIPALLMRGTKSYLGLLPGVVLQNDALYIRGSRAGELGFFMNGFSVTNRFFNNEGVTVIPEAIETLELHSGPYSAEYGHANGGFVMTRMRTGGEKLEFSLSYQTDDFAKPGEKFLNTSQGKRTTRRRVSQSVLCRPLRRQYHAGPLRDIYQSSSESDVPHL